MTRDPNTANAGAPAADKFELHYRQQLSALVDGELAPDEARFLLRRLQHDGELSGRLERWQLCGDVLRGQVKRVAEPGFAARVAAAVALESTPVAQPALGSGGRRLAWTRWSGGAALAASVAAVAIFVGRPAATDPAFAPAAAVAVQTLPSTDAVLASAPATSVAAEQAMPPPVSQPRPAPVQRERLPRTAVARASVDSGRARAVPATGLAQEPALAIASAPANAVADAGATGMPVLAPEDPFASSMPLQARPWPRAVLSQSAGSGFTASVTAPADTRAFYPFEPRLPAPPAAGPASPDGGELPAPPDDGSR